MTALALDVLSWVLLCSGAALAVTGGIGMLRMPEFYTRIHASSVTDTGGALLIMGGLLCQVPDLASAVRLLLVLGFMLLTTPTATHALAKAAQQAGIAPAVNRKKQ